MPTQTKDYYQLLDNNIHRFEIDSSTQSIDFHFKKMPELLANHNDGEPFLLIFDITEANKMPTIYFMNAVRNFWRNHEKPSMMYGAYLYTDSFIISLFARLMGVLGFGNNRKFFRPHQEADAIAWLLELAQQKKQAA